MRATIEKPLIFKAAATIANGGYNTSILQIERKGDAFAMIGTNTYVAVIAEVEASFTRWPDGQKVRFNGGDVQAIMRGIGKALKHAATLTIDVAKDYATFGLLVDGSEVLVKIDYDKDGAGTTIRDLDSIGKYREHVEGDPHLASYLMTLAANAMRTIGQYKHSTWEMRSRGKENVVEWVADDEPVRVLVMPVCR